MYHDRSERQARARHGRREPPQPVVGDRPAAPPGRRRAVPDLRGRAAQVHGRGAGGQARRARCCSSATSPRTTTIDAVRAAARRRDGARSRCSSTASRSPARRTSRARSSPPRARASSCALEVSAYSLLNVTNRMLPLLEKNGASIVTLSYLAAERAVPSYNVMGSAKAVLEQSVRQLAYELGPEEHPRQRGLGRPGEHARRARHPRLHRHAQEARRDGAAQAQHHQGRGRQGRAVPALRPRERHHRRSALRGRGLPHHGVVTQGQPIRTAVRGTAHRGLLSRSAVRRRHRGRNFAERRLTRRQDAAVGRGRTAQ